MSLLTTTTAAMRRGLARHGARWGVGAALSLLVCASVLGLLPGGLAERLDLAVYDWRMRLDAPTLDTRIAIVDIDEKSLAELGRWPWSRDVVAQLVTKLGGQYRARAIGFDVMFSEPDTSSGYATLAALAGGELKDVPAFGARVKALKPALDYDARLAASFAGQPVVLAFYLANQAGAGLLPAPAFGAAQLGGRQLDALVHPGYIGNLAPLQKGARGGGFMNTELDPDGLLRSAPLLARIGDDFYESLALATARVALGAGQVRPVFFGAGDVLMSAQDLQDYGMLEAVELDSSPRIRIPVEPDIKTLIQFRGRGGPHGGAFRYVSAVDVLKGRVPQPELEGRIMLIGTTASGLNDLRATPVNADYPGVEAHANIIASILDGQFKQRPDFAAGFELVQVLLLAGVLIVTLSALSPLYSILSALAAALLVAGFNLWMYRGYDLVLPVANALLLILGLFLLNIAWGYLFEYGRRHAMASLFGQYVAPELVAEMADNPEGYSMEGDSRELTVLFADVRGFTTISEGLTPNALHEYINLYLTAMSEDIRGNRGTLDKYIGDAVMAFWGAPVRLPDHAARAVASALLMQASAKRLSAAFVERGWPPLKIGIGINTGQMHVGDMGSQIRRAYTVMGDAVNLGSRLEGITKVYGVGLLVGQATMLAAPQYAYRELDRVRVKGKNEPVPIYEPLALVEELDEATRATVAQWHAALAAVRAQRWDEAEQIVAELRRAHPDDGLYALYAERIAHLRANPPGTDWDGVTTFDTK
jgi:adenylate cyclase